MPSPISEGGERGSLRQETNCCERYLGETETPPDRQMVRERQRDGRLHTVQRKDIKQGGRVDFFSLIDRQRQKNR